MTSFKLKLNNKYKTDDYEKYKIVNLYLTGLDEVITHAMIASNITQPVRKNTYIQFFSEILDDFFQKRYPSEWSYEAIQVTEDSLNILTTLVVEFYFNGQNPPNLESYAEMVRKSGEVLYEEY